MFRAELELNLNPATWDAVDTVMVVEKETLPDLLLNLADMLHLIGGKPEMRVTIYHDGEPLNPAGYVKITGDYAAKREAEEKELENHSNPFGFERISAAKIAAGSITAALLANSIPREDVYDPQHQSNAEYE